MASLKDNNLVLDEGEVLKFPLEDGDPLAKVQRMRRVTTLADVRHFAFVRDWAQGFTFPDERRDSGPERLLLDDMDEQVMKLEATAPRYVSQGFRLSHAELLGLIRERWGGVVMELKLADFIIPAGSTVLLTGALSEINANTVVIAGNLKFTDDLVIRCNEIRGN